MELYKGEIKRRLPPSYFKPPTSIHIENGKKVLGIFSGPITVDELKRRVALDKEIELSRQMKKKSKKEKENIPATSTTTLIQIGQPNIADLSDASNKTYDIEMSPKQELNTTFEILEETENFNLQMDVTHKTTNTPHISRRSTREETENFNLQMDITQKTTNTPRISRRSMRNYRQNQDSIFFETSNISMNETIENTPVLKEISTTNKTILSSLENLKLDDLCDSLSNVSYKDSPPAKSLLKDKSFPKTDRSLINFHEPNTKSKNSSTSMTDSARKRLMTPSKMSSTFITEMKAEKCLVSSPSEKASCVSNRSTPEIFRQKVNEISTTNPDTLTPFRSKLPQFKKSSSAHKFKCIASPVANYINRGIAVQSSSKKRHSHCTNFMENGSQSETKNRVCKIPQFRGNFTSKKKLQLVETSKTPMKSPFSNKKSNFI